MNMLVVEGRLRKSGPLVTKDTHGAFLGMAFTCVRSALRPQVSELSGKIWQ